MADRARTGNSQCAGVPAHVPSATQAAAGDDAMDVIVVEQRLAPRVQHGGEAELGVELFAAELQQRGRRGIEEQIITARLILANQRVERVRQREDQVEIRNRQQQFGLLLHPRATVRTLARRTVPVATGVRHEALGAAFFALIQMPAELRRAASRDRAEHPPMMRRQTMLGGVIW